MKMYHKDSKEPVDVHRSQIENAKAAGWTETKPSKPTKQKEVNEDGNAHGC